MRWWQILLLVFLAFGMSAAGVVVAWWVFGIIDGGDRVPLMATIEDTLGVNELTKVRAVPKDVYEVEWREAGFYSKPVSSTSSVRQVYLFGVLQKWNYTEGNMEIVTLNGKVVVVQTHAGGVRMPPGGEERVITRQQAGNMTGEYVTVWLLGDSSAPIATHMGVTRYAI